MGFTDKLLYFDSRGRAEPIRMLYALAGEPLIDERVSMEEWQSTYKTSRVTITMVMVCKGYYRNDCGSQGLLMQWLWFAGLLPQWL